MICKVPDCDHLHHARGWCKLHYSRWSRRGSPTPTPRRFPWTPRQDRELDRFDLPLREIAARTGRTVEACKSRRQYRRGRARRDLDW